MVVPEIMRVSTVGSDLVNSVGGNRARWRAMMRESIAVGVQQFSSDRMVSDYYTQLYRRAPVRSARRVAAL